MTLAFHASFNLFHSTQCPVCNENTYCLRIFPNFEDDIQKLTELHRSVRNLIREAFFHIDEYESGQQEENNDTVDEEEGQQAQETESSENEVSTENNNESNEANDVPENQNEGGREENRLEVRRNEGRRRHRTRRTFVLVRVGAVPIRMIRRRNRCYLLYQAKKTRTLPN